MAQWDPGREPEEDLHVFRGALYADGLSLRTQLGEATTRAQEVARERGDARLSAAALSYSLVALAPRADPSECARVHAEALRACEAIASETLRWFITASEVRTLVQRRQLIEAIALSDRLLRSVPVGQHPSEMAYLCHVRAMALKWAGRLDDALIHYRLALSEADKSGYPYLRAAARLNLADMLLEYLFDAQGALALADEAQQLLLAEEVTGLWMYGVAARIKALDVRQEAVLAHEAFERGTARPGAGAFHDRARGGTALALIGVGRLDEAERWLRGAPAHVPRVSIGGDLEMVVAHARLLAASGQHAALRNQVEQEMDRTLSYLRTPRVEALLFRCLAEACDALGDTLAARQALVAMRKAALPMVRRVARARYQEITGGASRLPRASGEIAGHAVKLEVLDGALADYERLLLGEQRQAPAPVAVPVSLARIVHDLRAPVGNIKGLSQLLGRAPMDDKHRGLLGLVDTSADSLMLLIDDLLDLARIERGQIDIKPVATSLPAWLHGCVEPFRPLAQQKALGLTLEVDPQLPQQLVFDPARLQQVISNLLSNALKFTAKGAVNVRAVAGPAPQVGRCLLRVEVQDSGKGIAAAALGRLFADFSQEDATIKPVYGGTGLGLAICRGIVQAMQGRIQVQSTQGEGSTFWFELALPTADEGGTRETTERGRPATPAR